LGEGKVHKGEVNNEKDEEIREEKKFGKNST